MTRVQEHYARARQSLAGGVAASTRLNRALGHPMYFERARGCRVWDLDGRELIDLCCSHGATLLGHGDERIAAAVRQAFERGAPCSYEFEQHAELAELLCETIPCCERVRFTGAGTEATMHCLRLARAFTGRSRILKFEGNFHGYHDQVMWAAQPPSSTRGEPAATGFEPLSAGVARGLGDNLIEVPYNDRAALELAFARYGTELAAVICEPVYYNAGCIVPTPEFMAGVRRLTNENGVVLIFDEVLSAFRMGPGGAQEYLSITPDLCTLGKAVGGGVPFSVFGGREEIMRRLMPEGDCQHSGTYNGHPVAVAAALAAVQAYREPGFYDHIHTVAHRLYSGLNELFRRRSIDAHVQGLGARFGIYFGCRDQVRCWADAQRHDKEKMLRFIAAANRHGVYFHDYGGGACHHGFCHAMTLQDVDEALQRIETTVGEMG